MLIKVAHTLNIKVIRFSWKTTEVFSEVPGFHRSKLGIILWNSWKICHMEIHSWCAWLCKFTPTWCCQNGRYYWHDIFKNISECKHESFSFHEIWVPEIHLTKEHHWFGCWLVVDWATSHYLTRDDIAHYFIYSATRFQRVKVSSITALHICYLVR